ncbi:MAG: hypothetical protein ACR2LX_02280 [Jatrophihabitans sp.]
MTETPGDHLDEEPQDERGASGSRDTGSDEPNAGPSGRPAGKSDEESDTSIAPQPSDPDAPHLQSP